MYDLVFDFIEILLVLVFWYFDWNYIVGVWIDWFFLCFVEMVFYISFGFDYDCE